MPLEERQVTYFARWLKKKKKAYETQNPGNRRRAACVWLAHAPQCGDPAWGCRIQAGLAPPLLVPCSSLHSPGGILSLQKSTSQIPRAKL